jgi:hypothetical protein
MPEESNTPRQPGEPSTNKPAPVAVDPLPVVKPPKKASEE